MANNAIEECKGKKNVQKRDWKKCGIWFSGYVQISAHAGFHCFSLCIYWFLIVEPSQPWSPANHAGLTCCSCHKSLLCLTWGELGKSCSGVNQESRKKHIVEWTRKTKKHAVEWTRKARKHAVGWTRKAEKHAVDWTKKAHSWLN